MGAIGCLSTNIRRRQVRRRDPATSLQGGLTCCLDMMELVSAQQALLLGIAKQSWNDLQTRCPASFVVLRRLLLRVIIMLRSSSFRRSEMRMLRLSRGMRRRRRSISNSSTNTSNIPNKTNTRPTRLHRFRRGSNSNSNSNISSRPNINNPSRHIRLRRVPSRRKKQNNHK